MIATLARRALAEAEETFHYYVDSAAGNDSNPGTRGLPYATLAKALTVAGAGQSIGLKAGSTFRPASVPAIPAGKMRLGKYGQGAKPIISGGSLVTGWTAQPGAGGATFVQRFVSASPASAASLVVTVAATTTAGNFAILAGKLSGGVAVSTVVDSRGNTWTVDKKSANASGGTAFVASARLTTALQVGDTITVTPAATASGAFAAYEYSGISASPADASATGNGTSTTASAGPTSATVQANELAVSVVASGSSLAGLTPPAGYTERASGQTTNAVDLADRVLSATGAQTAAWTIPNVQWAEVLQTYKSATPAASNTSSASLAASPVYVTSKSGSTITSLVKGTSAAALTANQWFWSSGTLYVNLGGTDPSTVTIEAAVRQALTANTLDGLTLRNVEFRHGVDRMVQLTKVNNFVVDRCEFRFAAYVSNSGTLSFGWSSASPSTATARITRCTIARNQNDGIWWSGMPNVEIDHNVVSNVGNLPGDVQSDAFQVYLGFGSCAGFRIHHNVTDMSATSSPKGHFACEGNPGHDLGLGARPAVFEWNDCTGGAYVFGGNASNLDVRFNTCRNQIIGGGQLQVDATGGTSTNLRIYRNLLIGGAAAGLYVASGGPALVGFVCANNTVVDCAGIPLNVQPASLDSTSIVANNLVWNPNVAPSKIVKAYPTSGGLPAGWDYNLFPADFANAYEFRGTLYASLAAFGAAQGVGSHSKQGVNPLLDASYRPGAGSPARDAGRVIAGITDGFVGAAPDLGYVEG